MALCDEFVPADPPEYFFDRFITCLLTSKYFLHLTSEYFFDRFKNVFLHLLDIINLVLFTVNICFDQTTSDVDLLFGLFGTIDLNLKLSAERKNCQRYLDFFLSLQLFVESRLSVLIRLGISWSWVGGCTINLAPRENCDCNSD